MFFFAITFFFLLCSRIQILLYIILLMNMYTRIRVDKTHRYNICIIRKILHKNKNKVFHFLSVFINIKRSTEMFFIRNTKIIIIANLIPLYIIIIDSYIIWINRFYFLTFSSWCLKYNWICIASYLHYILYIIYICMPN